MLIAGEASGDLLAAEQVFLNLQSPLPPQAVPNQARAACPTMKQRLLPAVFIETTFNLAQPVVLTPDTPHLSANINRLLADISGMTQAK